jgi:hypothetical protein
MLSALKMAISDWIKNIESVTNVLFLVTAGIVGILTYRSAKETFLQPVRSEVIKRQTELLIDIFTSFKNQHAFDVLADYQGTIALNLFDSLKICGAIFKEDAKVEKFLSEEVGGAILIPDSSGEIRGIEKITVFENKKEETKDKTDYEAALKGKYKISILNFSRKCAQFQNSLNDYIENPLLPSELKSPLKILQREFRDNFDHVRKSVETAVNQFYTGGQKSSPNPGGVYNDFNNQRISHQKTINEINQKIRLYLKIDSMPK